MYDRFEGNDAIIIAVSQEDNDLSTHGRFRGHFKPEPRFEIVADIGREKTRRYDRTTTYLIDKQGKVRQIFPMLVHARANWFAVLDELMLLRSEGY